MPWCPKCRNEYVEGKKHCPDCDVDLVEELPLKTEAPVEIPEDYEFPEDFRPEEILEGQRERPAPAKQFKSAGQRYEDARSSAYTFLAVGGLGLIAMIPALAGIYSLPFHDFALFVMTAFFSVFLVIGALSLKNSVNLKASIETEQALIEKIKTWYHTEGIHSGRIEDLDADLPEELFYFQKYDAVRQCIQEHFPGIDEALLDKLASDFCEE